MDGAPSSVRESTVADYARIGVLHGLRCRIRNRIFDPLQLVPYLPDEGAVLDLGCGDGFIANFVGRLRPGVTVTGVEIDEGKLALARAARQSERVELSPEWPAGGTFAAVLCIDVLHHIAPDRQSAFLSDAIARIQPGGVLVLKDIDGGARWRAALNQLHDLVWSREWVHARPRAFWREIVEQAGLTLTDDVRCYAFGYPHFILVARR